VCRNEQAYIQEQALSIDPAVRQARLSQRIAKHDACRGGKRNPRPAALWRLRRRILPGMDVKLFRFPKIGNILSPYPAYREIMAKRFPENEEKDTTSEEGKISHDNTLIC
jgi:hypothetical protein